MQSQGSASAHSEKFSLIALMCCSYAFAQLSKKSLSRDVLSFREPSNAEQQVLLVQFEVHIYRFILQLYPYLALFNQRSCSGSQLNHMELLEIVL